MELYVLLSTFVLTLILGLPIYAVLGSSVFMYFLVSDINLVLIPHRMFAGLDVFVLLAIPFFMLVGNLMNYGGMTRRLIDVAEALVGWMKGGLAYVNVVVSMLFSGISGSAAADTAAVGSIMIRSMPERGYTREFATAVTVASSTIGPIIPPSIALIIYAVIAEASVKELFLAGFIPGAILGLAQMALVAYFAWRLGFARGEAFSMHEVFRAARDGILPLGLPVIILGGIFSGFFTPTEAAAVACFYAFVIGKYVYGEIQWRDIPTILFESAKTAGTALVIVGIATPLAWILTREGVPMIVAETILSISDNEVVVLLLINLILLLLGTFMEILAAMLIMVPILLPVVVSLGVDPVHFGIIVALNLTFGMITPPVGICLFIGATISNLSLERVAWATLPFLAVSVLILVIITFSGDLVMWLPGLYSGRFG